MTLASYIGTFHLNISHTHTINIINLPLPCYTKPLFNHLLIRDMKSQDDHIPTGCKISGIISFFYYY